MSEKWKEDRKEKRRLLLEYEIKRRREDAVADEKLITAIESRRVAAFLPDVDTVYCDGAEIKTNTIVLETVSKDDSVQVGIGFNKKAGENGYAVLSINRGAKSCSSFKVMKDDNRGTLDLVFYGKDSLSEVGTILKAWMELFLVQLDDTPKHSACIRNKKGNKKPSRNGGAE